MMAKMFYTLDEAKTALGKSEEEIKQFSRDGRLREFRDGPRLMFKADQVETLKKELSGPQSDVGMSDSGSPVVTDGKAASGASMTLSDEGSGRSPGAGMQMKDDTALAQDLGLSGTVGGVPSPARPSGSGTGLSNTSGSRAGIDVFHADEVERVDPSAQTTVGKTADKINLDAVGSGSGLLDLTRESDDTSLGAELLDEIAPGSKGKKVEASSKSSIADTISEPLITPRSTTTMSAPVYVEAADPLAPAFGAAALAAGFVALFGIFVLMSGVAGTYPPIIQNLAERGLFVILAMGFGACLLFGVFGFIFGRTASK